MRHDEFGWLSKGLIAFKWLDGLVDRDRHVGPPFSTVNGIYKSLRGHVNVLKTGSLAEATLFEFLPVLSARGVITTTALFMAEAVKRPILILLYFLSRPIGPWHRY